MQRMWRVHIATFEFNVSKNVHAGKQRDGAGNICAAKRRFGNYVGGLEPDACRQGHGNLERSVLDGKRRRDAAKSVCGAKLDADYKTATLTVSVDVRNSGSRGQGDFATRDRWEPLGASRWNWRRRVKESELRPEKFAQLKLEHPRIWWPYQMGEPNLYTSEIELRDRTEAFRTPRA